MDKTNLDSNMKSEWFKNVDYISHTHYSIVYSLRYKTWSDVIGQIVDSHDSAPDVHDPIEQSRNKYFVSKGGIISFSARNSDGKQSVPVTFKY